MTPPARGISERVNSTGAVIEALDEPDWCSHERACAMFFPQPCMPDFDRAAAPRRNFGVALVLPTVIRFRLAHVD